VRPTRSSRKTRSSSSLDQTIVRPRVELALKVVHELERHVVEIALRVDDRRDVPPQERAKECLDGHCDRASKPFLSTWDAIDADRPEAFRAVAQRRPRPGVSCAGILRASARGHRAILRLPGGPPPAVSWCCAIRLAVTGPQAFGPRTASTDRSDGARSLPPAHFTDSEQDLPATAGTIDRGLAYGSRRDRCHRRLPARWPPSPRSHEWGTRTSARGSAVRGYGGTSSSSTTRRRRAVSITL
jgi:hypothetical protein